MIKLENKEKEIKCPKCGLLIKVERGIAVCVNCKTSFVEINNETEKWINPKKLDLSKADLPRVYSMFNETLKSFYCDRLKKNVSLQSCFRCFEPFNTEDGTGCKTMRANIKK